jgi:hypothetical protein
MNTAAPAFDLRPTLRRVLHAGHRYRLALCGHKAAEIGAACLLLMVQGNVAQVTLGHFLIASKTGMLAVLPALGVTFLGRAMRVLTNRWTSALFFTATAFAADAVTHESHYPGAWTEAALTAIGGGLIALAVSYTPIGRRIDRLAEHLADAGRAKRRSEVPVQAGLGEERPEGVK